MKEDLSNIQSNTYSGYRIPNIYQLDGRVVFVKEGAEEVTYKDDEPITIPAKLLRELIIKSSTCDKLKKTLIQESDCIAHEVTRVMTQLEVGEDIKQLCVKAHYLSKIKQLMDDVCLTLEDLRQKNEIEHFEYTNVIVKDDFE